MVDNWLRHVGDVANKHHDALAAVDLASLRQPRVCAELNVIEQVVNVCQTTVVDDAWARGQNLTVHGWISCSLFDGRVRDFGLDVSARDELAPYPTSRPWLGRKSVHA